MAKGDITAGEVFEDREMLNRLGYGIFDLAWGSSGIGSENVKDFSYLVAENKDPKIYRRKVYNLIGRYFENKLAEAIWNKFIDHKWVLAERAGHDIDLKVAAEDWFKNYGHDFLKDWTFRRAEIPSRIRSSHEFSRSFLELMAGLLVPNLRELLFNGFTVTDIIKAAITTPPGRVRKLVRKRNRRNAILPSIFRLRRHRNKTKGVDATQEVSGGSEKQADLTDPPYLVVKKLDGNPSPEERGRYYIHLVASLTGHAIKTPEEAEKRWQEILEHKWYMSERQGQDVGIRAAALDYYRRLNLLEESETGQEA